MRYSPKHTKPNKPHFSVWIMRTAAVIGCLTLLSAYLLLGVYAKFFTIVSGADGARVAKWDISTALLSETASFSLFDADGMRSAEYSFAVTSNSEVALSYDIVITLPEALSGVTFALKDQDALLSVSEDGLVYTFSDAGSFAVNGGTKEHILTITASEFNRTVTLSGIAVRIVAEQIG